MSTSAKLVVISLRLFGKKLDFGAIDEAVGRSSTKRFATGDAAPGNRTQRTSLWLWNTEHLLSTKLSHHVEQIAATAIDRDLRATLSHLGVERADVLCHWESRYGHGGPTLTVEDMGVLARLGLDLHFNFMDASED